MAAPRTTCPNCLVDVEALRFCGNCGDALDRGETGTDNAGRVSLPMVVETGPSSRRRGATSGPAGTRVPRIGRAGALAFMRRALGAAWAPRLVLAAAAVSVLAALLLGQTGLALLVAAVAVPALALATMVGVDVYEREPWPWLLAVAAGGVVAGIAGAVANTLLVDNLWFDDGAFQAGAAAFDPGAVTDPGSPPALVLVLCGVVVPLVAASLAMAGPVALRRRPEFRNEVVDGITLGVAAGGGLAMAATGVYFWPVVRGDPPAASVADWTGTLLAVTLVRPLVPTIALGLVGGAIWHHALSQHGRDLYVPLFLGVVATVALSVGGLLVLPVGIIAGLGVVAALLVLVAAAFRWHVRRAVAYDRRVLGAGGNRVVCGSCRALTPAGSHCARCGARLRGGGALQSEPVRPRVLAVPVLPADAPRGVTDDDATLPIVSTVLSRPEATASGYRIPDPDLAGAQPTSRPADDAATDDSRPDRERPAGA